MIGHHCCKTAAHYKSEGGQTMCTYLLEPQIKEYNFSGSDFLRARLSESPMVLDSLEL